MKNMYNNLCAKKKFLADFIRFKNLSDLVNALIAQLVGKLPLNTNQK